MNETQDTPTFARAKVLTLSVCLWRVAALLFAEDDVEPVPIVERVGRTNRAVVD